MLFVAVLLAALSSFSAQKLFDLNGVSIDYPNQGLDSGTNVVQAGDPFPSSATERVIIRNGQRVLVVPSQQQSTRTSLTPGISNSHNFNPNPLASIAASSSFSSMQTNLPVPVFTSTVPPATQMRSGAQSLSFKALFAVSLVITSYLFE